MQVLKKLFSMFFLLVVIVLGDNFLLAQEVLPIVRMRSKMSVDSRRGVEQFISFYDELQNDESLNDWTRRGLTRQQERIINGLRGSSLGIVYLDNIGRHFLITGANIAMFSDFAQVEYLTNNGFRSLGEAYVIHRDREKDVAIYLMMDDLRPFANGLMFGGMIQDGDVALAYSGHNQDGDFVKLTTTERGRWQVSDGLMTNQIFTYGAPIFDPAGGFLGLVGMERNFINHNEIQPILKEAERVRPRATQGALERSSLRLVNAVMGENYTDFSILFSANLTSSLGIPLFLDVLSRSNQATRSNYLSALRDEDPTLLINTILGMYIMDRFNEFEQPIFEQMRVGNVPSYPFQNETKISYNLNQKLYAVSWIYSAGSWRISNLDSFNFIEKRSVFRKIDRNGMTLGLGYSFIPEPKDIKNLYASVGYYHQIHPFFGMSGEIVYHSLAYRMEPTAERLQMMHAYLKAQIQVGLAFESFNLLLFGGVGSGLGFRLGDGLEDPRFERVLANRQRVLLNLGWFSGLEIGFTETTPIFVGLEGGLIEDFFSNKYLTIHFRERSRTNAFYLKGYIKYRFY